MERVPEARAEANERFVGCRLKHNIPELSCFLEANPGGVDLTVVAGEISARWKSLSKEDRITITAECMEEIEEEREAKDLASHNVPLQAFYDARSTMRAVEKEVCTWLLTVRSMITDQPATPRIVSTIVRKNWT
jgi:hypothetical protein